MNHLHICPACGKEWAHSQDACLLAIRALCDECFYGEERMKRIWPRRRGRGKG